MAAAVVTFLSGYKTYIAAAGLLGQALYLASIGNYPGAVHSVLLALVAAGLRGAMATEAANQTKEIQTITEDQTKEISAKVEVATAKPFVAR